MARDTRQTRAEELTDVNIYDFGNGVYALHCTNDRGEPRKMILEPSDLYSSSNDMKYRPVIGKYMRRLAMENPKAAKELRTATRQRIQELDTRSNDLRDAADTLSNQMDSRAVSRDRITELTSHADDAREAANTLNKHLVHLSRFL